MEPLLATNKLAMDKLQKLIEDAEKAAKADEMDPQPGTTLDAAVSWRMGEWRKSTQPLKILRILKAFQDLMEAAKLVDDNGPCSDPDCCQVAMDCEKARNHLKLAMGTAMIAVDNL